MLGAQYTGQRPLPSSSPFPFPAASATGPWLASCQPPPGYDAGPSLSFERHVQGGGTEQVLSIRSAQFSETRSNVRLAGRVRLGAGRPGLLRVGSRQGIFLPPVLFRPLPGLRRATFGESPSSAEALAGAPLRGASVGRREPGWSKCVPFSNDWNVEAYVMGMLILWQGREGCKGLLVCSLSSCLPRLLLSRAEGTETREGT